MRPHTEGSTISLAGSLRPNRKVKSDITKLPRHGFVLYSDNRSWDLELLGKLVRMQSHFLVPAPGIFLTNRHTHTEAGL